MLQVSHACHKSFHQDSILSSAVLSTTFDGKFSFEKKKKKEKRKERLVNNYIDYPNYFVLLFGVTPLKLCNENVLFYQEKSLMFNNI